MAVELRAPSIQALRLLCLFHLNLAFSSLEEESHAEVIRRCYRPALELARDTDFPIALEATGWTLRRIAELDPGWIALLRELLKQGKVEFVGSAHAQCAAPLLPAQVNAWNLRLGREVYQELLGVMPRIALVCEQVYSPGLVPLYLEAGYEALIVDWDNARRSHLQWPAEHRLHPQRALGGGRSMPIIWSKSIAFQKFQRFAHGELSLERYIDYVRGVAGGDGHALMLYANDVEIFDHRPGRFAAEPDLQEGEWQRIAQGLRALREQGVGIPALPCDVLDLLGAPGAGHELQLESPSQPIPVKKQDKYNVSRWAVTGRDDIGINTRCRRLYEQLRRDGSADPERWRELCELWASDFRTHITESRWQAFLARLARVEREWLPAVAARKIGLSDEPDGLGDEPDGLGDEPDGLGDEPDGLGDEPDGLGDEPDGLGDELDGLSDGLDGTRDELESISGDLAAVEDGDILDLRRGALTLRLNLRRGMAIEAFGDSRVSELPLLGTLEHGYFPTIELGADFYSGHLVQESPLTHKVTDLERVRPAVGVDARGALCAQARIDTELGPIDKSIRLDAGGAGIELEWVLHWPELPLGSLRLGHVTLLPESFRAPTLWYATHNGGAELVTHLIAGSRSDTGSESHPIAYPAFDHGAAVSALVSCRQGLGMTEGVVLLGDAQCTLRVEIDQSCACPLGLDQLDPRRRAMVPTPVLCPHRVR